MGHPPRRPRHPCPRPGRVRDPQRRDSLRRSRTGRRPCDRTARRTDHRTHPQRPQRGAHHRLRDRLRDPLSHLDFPVHRCCAAGGLLPQGTRADRGRRRACASPRRWPGLQTGVQDAVNLGWKLAQVVKGTSPESLLDTYHAERHPIGARVLRNTMASIVLRRADERTNALRETFSELLSLDEARKRFAATMSGLDVRYDLGHFNIMERHPLLGRRMPDLDIVTAAGPSRVFSLLHDARPILLNFDEPGRFDIAPWADRVRRVDASYAGSWELPALGTVAAP